ncbi:SDR family NAD(P)-dependent oxidoreductase [Shimia sagamensis]|uniref:Short-chain dehydrogenase n=1 Tax=Shimia sagamensis TaxID=1566352 RepID=A0ABY1NMU5_9RHOB|nr:SDR family NAD(P)-dependent oxidoreductase [Shimia sagamensis]SMP13238.1 Short-chain dehydrogenase [Shimia sagamensis]
MSMSLKSQSQKTAVISGGAGGLGTALSAQLQDEGWQVVLLDLNVDHLSTTATQQAMKCDITNPQALQECCATILSSHPSIDLVIYGAGVTAIAPIEDLKEQAHRRLFDINYFAAVAMAQAFQPALRASKGTHLAITSVAGFAPLRHRASYVASKHAMTGFFASLRIEEAKFGVKTVIAAPAFVATNVGNPDADKNGLTRPGAAQDAVDVVTPEQAASIILRGLKRGRSDIFVGRVARLSDVMMRLSPKLYGWVMRRTIQSKPKE